MKAPLAAFAAAVLLFPYLAAVAQTLPPACGLSGQTLKVKTTKSAHAPIHPAPGTATLVFANNESECIGCAVVNVGVDGHWVGANQGNSYFAVAVAPGERHVCVYWSVREAYLRSVVDLTELHAEAGQVDYFRTDVDNGSRTGQPQLRVWAISPDEGNFLVSQSSLASSPSTGH